MQITFDATLTIDVTADPIDIVHALKNGNYDELRGVVEVGNFEYDVTTDGE